MVYEKWENPRLIEENQLPARASFENEESLSLNGKWKFCCCLGTDRVPENFGNADFDVSGWEEIDVPCCWETRGYGAPYYYGAGFPPALSKAKKKIPMIDHKQVYVGMYQRTVEVDSDWVKGQTILRFGSVKSAFYCWVNGNYVGMGKGSMLPVEFDVTNDLKAGENTVSVQVYQFSDATYLEDQDMWFLSGIYRDVTLYTQPQSCIADVYASAALERDYRDGRLTVWAETKNAKGMDVTVEVLWEETVVASGSKHMESEDDAVQLSVFCQEIHLWSAETPNLYHIRVSLKDAGGVVQERIVEFGFREIFIDRKKAQLLINGQPLKLRGINYHAFTPDQGYYVSREVYERDLQTMKRFNINAIRTSHYPQDEYFYHLCNQYGIYVMDECNVETHAVRSKNVPGDNPVWTAHVTDRMRRMVLRDRNHPCVVIWSLGNESDVGSNHYRMKEEALKLDATRPIHYEGGSDLTLSDFLCDGYSAPEREQMFADGKDVQKNPGVLQKLLPLQMSLDSVKFEDYKDHPIVATEYGYCMGNSGSDVEKHIQIYEASDRWCGGFIWDFKDKTLTKECVNGKPFQAYGGDYGVKDQRGNVCCDGAADWNGIPHEGMYEIKKAFQPLACSLKDAHTIEIFNRNSFLDVNRYRCRWELSHDGKIIETGEEELSILPRERGQLTVFWKSETTSAGSYYLKVEFLLKEDSPWALAGHVVAYEQWKIAQRNALPSLEEMEKDMGKTGRIVNKEQSICMETGKETFVISKETGDVIRWEAFGENLLKAPLRPAFFRAVTDADAGFVGLAMGKERKLDAWGKLSLLGVGKPTAIRVETGRVVVEHQWKGACYRRTYTIAADGGLVIAVTLKTGKHAPVRLGMQMELDSRYDTFTWYGKGPHDTYWGRECSGTVDIHSKKVSDQDEHVRPQEHGNKQNVFWMTLTDQEGKGIRADAVNSPIAASAWPYTLRQLQEAQHVHELPDFASTTVNIDGIQNGLGDCFVPCPQKYKLMPLQTYSYAFSLSTLS